MENLMSTEVHGREEMKSYCWDRLTECFAFSPLLSFKDICCSPYNHINSKQGCTDYRQNYNLLLEQDLIFHTIPSANPTAFTSPTAPCLAPRPGNAQLVAARKNSMFRVCPTQWWALGRAGQEVPSHFSFITCHIKQGTPNRHTFHLLHYPDLPPERFPSVALKETADVSNRCLWLPSQAWLLQHIPVEDTTEMAWTTLNVVLLSSQVLHFTHTEAPFKEHKRSFCFGLAGLV